jgi:hypothetical protein
MKVSTVIPVYNRQELVKRAIASAQAQRVDGHEIVVIDNCSTDSTWEVVQGFAKSDSRIRCIRNDQNIGPVRNWRLGVQASIGEYCHLLFSDDCIEPVFLDETLKVFDSRTALVLTGHTILDSQTVRAVSNFQSQEVISREEFLEAAVFLNPKEIQLLSPLSALFRRSDMLESLIDEIPNPFGIDFAVHGAGPDQLIFMLTAVKYPFVRCVNKRLAVMHAHAGSITIQARDLSLPREFARWYFVDKHWPQARESYRSMLWLKSRKNPVYRALYEHIDQQVGGRMRIGNAIDYGIRRLLRLRGSYPKGDFSPSTRSR